MEKKGAAGPGHKNARFVLAAAAALACCMGAALWLAVPLRPAGQQAAQSVVPFAQAAQVDLNTAGLDALCTLPGVGESRARAIIAYRVEHGRFAAVDEAANVPGITQAVVDSWAELACVSKGWP